eukprot:TRINITY_DN9319_c0_g1_i2.p1 TRINITY_DN9319_c0_g1~~TRINITY_DN9319_c0_g1_i2.p1  ORF type:complete len:214 (+),score=50.99 TRINITY_DN9319_c0_g1_i2:81-722(+)
MNVSECKWLTCCLISAKQAPAKWAQRADCVYLTIAVTDCKEPKITLTETSLQFQGKCGPQQEDYSCSIEFFAEIVPAVGIHFARDFVGSSVIYRLQDSTKRVSDRNLFFNIKKKDTDAEFWPRLTKEKVKLQWLKVDFDKWADEDDEDEEVQEPDLGGMQNFNMEEMMAQMNMGGAGGAPGGPGGDAPDMSAFTGAAADEDDDSDDDDIPDLE